MGRFLSGFRRKLTVSCGSLLILAPLIFIPSARALVPTPGGSLNLSTDANFRVAGSSSNAQIQQVVPLGDVNGDGIPDVAVVAGNLVRVIFGPLNHDVDMASTNFNGFDILVNVGPGGQVDVSAAGDVNGDGLNDIAIGSPNAYFPDTSTPTAGAVFIVYGKADTSTIDLTISNLSAIGNHGYVIVGPRNGSFFGGSVSGNSGVAGIGDVNNDGVPDVAVGASNDGVPGNGGGTAYVIYGKHDNSTVFTSSLGNSGYYLNSSDNYYQGLGTSVASAGDFNGDGHPDVIIGGPGGSFATKANGVAYVLPGGQYSGAVDPVMEIDGTTTTDSQFGSGSGFTVASAGDINSDGFGDVMVGAPQANPMGRSNAGAVYVVAGRSSIGQITLGAPGSTLTEIDGPSQSSFIGNFTITSGDVNGDGYPDLVIGGPFAQVSGSGTPGVVYIVDGSSSVSTSIDLANLGNQGSIINGENNGDLTGYSVATYDFDLDGKADVVITAPGASPLCRQGVGEAFVILSGSQSGTPSQVDCNTNNPPTVNSFPGATINEGGTYSSTGSFSDPDSSSWTATVDYGDGSGAQPLTLSGTSFTLSHTYKDNGSYTVTVSVTDNQGATGSASATVTVNNVTPSVGTITLSPNPVQINSTVSASANFTDPGVLDTHTASWGWGDGNTTAGTVSETSGSGSVTGSHTYATPGVYAVTLTVTDKDGGTGASVFQYEAAYDPTPQGLFTAVRLFTSPAGAYAANTNLTGQVQFGISAKYSGSAPTGNASMDFPAANFKFVATSISTLVIANGKATLQGTGTVNGQSGYTFAAVGIENSQNGGQDYIRFQVKDSSGNVVYDTQPGAALVADPTTPVTGKVIIH
jgi:PKD domain/FG-GAP repeat